MSSSLSPRSFFDDAPSSLPSPLLGVDCCCFPLDCPHGSPRFSNQSLRCTMTSCKMESLAFGPEPHVVLRERAECDNDGVDALNELEFNEVIPRKGGSRQGKLGKTRQAKRSQKPGGMPSKKNGVHETHVGRGFEYISCGVAVKSGGQVEPLTAPAARSSI